MQLDVGGPNSQIERFANMFMDRMADLQNSQNQMIQCILRTHGTAQDSGSAPLAALADAAAPANSRRLAPRRLPTVAFERCFGLTNGNSPSAELRPAGAPRVAAIADGEDVEQPKGAGDGEQPTEAGHREQPKEEERIVVASAEKLDRNHSS